ncbi:NAD(P)/FAD-dependent oxidoreductase [Halomonas sp. PR-M31]|uniref:NAD(P)/FAD-dependent oxidoreductase n=1 Tax=Halomonas sp. PR-M31 TaxID=1471202 RepID=UPI000650690C|nr:FAD-dependent oxidoreductase [Halomonas sp. PR-M31]
MHDSRFAVIGGGISGLACARALIRHGRQVRLFEKSRGPGGRLASRRTPSATFDLGAQYFTARSPEFQRELEAWQQANVIAPWPQSVWVCDDGDWHRKQDDHIRWVGTPRMSALTRHLSQDLDLHTQCRIEHLHREESIWWLQDDQGLRHGPFTQIILAIPSPQAQPLLAPHSQILSEACQCVEMSPCWTAYALFEAPLPPLETSASQWQTAFMNGGPLRFVARNDSKPGRGEQGESLSLLATAEWSQKHLERDADWVATQLLAAFAERYPVPLPGTKLLDAHRWRFSQPASAPSVKTDTQDFQTDSCGLALCGDAMSAGRIENAWLSGHHLGNHLSTSLETAI